MNVEAKTVARAMTERVTEAAVLEDVTSRSIHHRGLDTRAHGGKCRLLSFQDRGVDATCFRVRGADGYRASQIGAVSVQDAAEVQHHQVASGEHPIPSAIVRKR